MTATRTALVIPAWNEAESIGAVLSEVPWGLVDWVFVACGDSTDATAEIAVAHGAVALRQARRGYGAACRAGARAAGAAGAELVAFLDGDYSDPPAELGRILAPLLDGRADLVLGCRESSAAPEALPAHARLGNRMVLALLRLVLGRAPSDLPSFKALRLADLDRLEMQEMTYGWTIEMIVKSLRARLRIVEEPIAYRPRLAGASKVSGTLHGTLGAAWKLCSCTIRYASWRSTAGRAPGELATRPGHPVDS